MSSSEPNLRWHQPGVLGITARPDAIASVTTLLGRGSINAPDPASGIMSPLSRDRTPPRQPYGSSRLSQSGSKMGSTAFLNQHGQLQNAQLPPSSGYQLLLGANTQGCFRTSVPVNKLQLSVSPLFRAFAQPNCSFAYVLCNN